MIYLNNNKMFKRLHKISDFLNNSYKVYYLKFNELIISFNDY